MERPLARCRRYLMLVSSIRQLLADSVYHKNYTDADIERLIFTPIRYKKCLAIAKGGRLVSLMTWAFLDDAQVEGYLNRTRRLECSDFEGEDGELWFIDFIAPYGNVRSLIREYQAEFQKRYPDIRFGKMFRRAKGYDAKVIVRAA